MAIQVGPDGLLQLMVRGGLLEPQAQLKHSEDVSLWVLLHVSTHLAPSAIRVTLCWEDPSATGQREDTSRATAGYTTAKCCGDPESPAQPRPALTLTDRLRPALTLTDRLRPALTLTDRLRPALTLTDRLRPAQASGSSAAGKM
ncbi:hypothetical protein NHX12_013378 [Muraenolepis orangiensis]|uniref:Uncharacterized protein n=1 Tax=Muraenolepis orangiensis TaxID=630683 RepID=A0A9Q0DEU5_9TELE|nr:hypothetical protein NHX12_013378 [Muraenolepis orangiensis]